MEIVNNYEHSASSADVDDNGRKRKISSRVITTDDDIDDYREVESEVETVELGPEHSKLQRRNLSQPAEEQEEEANSDDRIVEESISDIYCSPPPISPIFNQEEEGTPTLSVPADGQAHKQQDTAEKSIPTVPRPQPETKRRMDSSPILARIASELDPPSKKSPSPSSPSSSSTATDDPPPEKSVPDQASRSRPESAAGSGSHSLTERGTKPVSISSPTPRFKGVGSSGLSTGIMIPTPPRNTDSGANGEEDGYRSPILSPGVKERLEQFDKAMMQIESRNGKEKEQRLEDGVILGKVKKSREEGEEKDGVTGSGRQEHGSVWTSQMKDKPGASPPKPPEIKKKKKTEPLFLSDESDSHTNSHARLKPQVEAKNQNSNSGSMERGKEQLNKRLSSHLPSDSSRLADTEEAKEDISFSTHAGSANTKHTDRETFNATSKTFSKTTSKPQSTNTAQASPPPSTTAVRRSVDTRSNSFVHDIIPETEESQSQSQETDMQVPIVSHLLIPPPTTPPPVNMKFALKSPMKPKPRPLSRTPSVVEVLALGVQLGIDMDVGNDADEMLNGELDGVDETVKKTSNKKANLAMTMGSSEPIPRISSRTSKSRSRSRSVSSQKGKNVKEPVPAEAETPFTVSIHRESLQASQPADSQVNITHDFPTVPISSSFAYQRRSAENSPHLGAAMHLLNTKSEEISKLENQLSAEQRTSENLLQQLSTLRRHITESTTNNTSSPTKTLEQELVEARGQLALQTVSWENERATLTLSIETAIRGKVSAEQDRDFFREQYTKASGFVTSVRDENTELEKQIKIAIDQAQSGVSLIKTTFDLRTKSLEEDARAWRRIAEFLIEKDHRTNDDIRRRAAEESELRARCDRQEGALEDFSERLLQKEMDLEEKERLFVEAKEARKVWQETTVKLNLDLNEAKTKLERIGKVGDESLPPNGDESVHRCQWRSDSDSNVACEAVFLDISVCFPILALPIIVNLSLIDRNFRSTPRDIFNWIDCLNLML